MAKGAAIVTGCAAKGIGRAIAIRLASDGFDVVLNDLPSRKADLEALSKEIQEQFPGRKTLVCAGDVSSDEFVKGMVDQTVEVYGGLDVMVANAGVCPVQSLLEVSAAEFDRIIGINLKGVFLCYQSAARVMIARGKGGRIIGASSSAGKQGVPFLPIYTASKAGIRGLTQATAGELGRHGITVNSYAPGVIETDLMQSSSAGLKEMTSISFADMAVKVTNLGRVGQPEEIAGWVSFIVGDDAKYITGQTMCINGGMYYD